MPVADTRCRAVRCGALLFTARNFTLSRRTFELTEQGQVTDRYTKAIEQRGSDKLDVRIGGIHALERPRLRKRSSDRYGSAHCIHPRALPQAVAATDPGGREQARSTRPDVQATVTVLGRRDAKRDTQEVDLLGAHPAGERRRC